MRVSEWVNQSPDWNEPASNEMCCVGEDNVFWLRGEWELKERGYYDTCWDHLRTVASQCWGRRSHELYTWNESCEWAKMGISHYYEIPLDIEIDQMI